MGSITTSAVKQGGTTFRQADLGDTRRTYRMTVPTTVGAATTKAHGTETFDNTCAVLVR